MRWGWGPLVVVALAVASCGGGSPSEEERVAQAVRDYAKAVRDRDGNALCGKLFPSSHLPPDLARKLNVPEGQPGKPSAWDRDKRECERDFRGGREFEGSQGARVEVGRVTLGPEVRADGISRTARVQGSFSSSKEPTTKDTVPMVKYRGDWKVVVGIN